MRTPYAAVIDSRFITAALSGTRTERNIIVSSRNDIPTTNAMTTQSLSASSSEMSSYIGVSPVSSVPAGRSARTSRTRSLTAGSAGPKVGSATTRVSSPSFESTGGATDAIRSSEAKARTVASTACCGESTAVWSTTASSAPLAPGPNSSSTRS